MLLTDIVTKKNICLDIRKLAIFILNKEKPKKILDMTTTEWLAKSLENFALFVIDCKKEDEIRSKILPFLNGYDYFMIINSNTPFITESLVRRIFEYVQYKDSNACKLFSGVVYNSRYYINTENIKYDNFYMQDQDSFATVETIEEISRAEQYFSSRIIYGLRQKGVIIDYPNNVIISAKCNIKQGVIIMSNCIIKGNTIIGENSVINHNTTIIDSKIGQGVSISNSIVTKSKIGDNSIICPYSHIDNSTIDKEAYIGYYCVVKNYKIGKKTILNDRTTIDEKGDK